MITSPNFPSIFVEESEKDENYHKQFIQAVASRGIVSGYQERFALMNECVNYYLSLQGGDEFEFLQKAEDGEVLPAKWMDFNKIAVKIDLLIGELTQRGYKVNVKASNKSAQSRKLEEKNRLLMEMRFAPIAQGLEEQFGYPIQQDNGFVPETEEQLDVYMNKSYKEKCEIVMRAILNYLRKFDGWDYQRIAMFRDLLIMGACFARNEVLDGIPHFERVDPRYMIFDSAAKDDFLSDATYWGEINYMSFSEVSKKYKISKKELEKAYKNYSDWMANQTAFASYSGDFGFLDQTSKLKLFKHDQAEQRVLVVTAYWQDINKMRHKYSEDKYGETHIKRMGDNSKGDNVKETPFIAWRKGTLIGGTFVKDFGYLKNQERSVDNQATTTPPFIALIPNFMNGAIVSKVNRLRPLQNLKNIALYNLQVEMATSGGKSFVYDIGQLPKGWDFHTAIKYLRTARIAVIDSSVDGAGAYNQFKDMDLGMSDSVNKYLEISMFLDREMDAVSGVNEARQGLIQGSSQAVGVTNSALLQSSLSTAMYYNLFSMFFTKIMNKQAGLAKIAWAGKERFAPIIGDVGVNFLEQDIDLDLQDYNAVIEEVPPVLADQQMFYQMVMTGIQSRQIPFVSGIKLLMEKDLDEAVLDLELLVAKQEAAQAQSQEDLMAQEQQALAQQAQASQQANQVKMASQQAKDQADLQKILTQGALDIKQASQGFKQDLALKKIDALIQKQKAKEKPKTRPK